MSPASRPAVDPHLFVARQPILDKSGRLRGYELLYRQTDQANTAAGASKDVATAAVIDALFNIGFDTLTGGKRAFINVSRQLLLDGIPSILPKDKVVLELGTDIEADADVLFACRELRHEGYSLAIDGFTLNEWTAELVPLAEFLKVGFHEATRSSVRLPSAPGGEGPALVATHIETAERFQEAVVGGYDLFQGSSSGSRCSRARARCRRSMWRGSVCCTRCTTRT